jgi:ACS family sodium-dependent inorganic phosphate cotransporter
VRVPRLPSMGADASSSAAASEAILDARIAAGSMDEFDGDENARAVPLAGLNSNGRQWLQQQQQQQQAAASGINSSSSTGDGGTSSSSTQQQQQDQQNAAAAAGTSSSTPQQQQQQQKQADTQVPWGAFLRSPPVWAVTVAHFCFNWGYYTLLAWLPSYFELALGLNVQESSFLTLIPYVAMVLMTPVVGPIADGLTKRGWRLTTVRKLAQGIAFVGPAACMVAVALLTPAAPGGAAGLQTAALVALLSLGFALGAWSRAGLYCNHQDLSPKYASALLGITNTAGALPGVLGVTSAGYLLDATGSWPLALFLPTAACQLFGAAFYALFASSERQPWS